MTTMGIHPKQAARDLVKVKGVDQAWYTAKENMEGARFASDRAYWERVWQAVGDIACAPEGTER